MPLCPWEPAQYLFFSSNVPSLFYYSHGISIVFALVFGLSIFLKAKKILSANLLFLITLLFSSWVILDLYIWASNNPSSILFFWSIIILIEVLIYIFSIYFIDVFNEKKDISFRKKLLMFALVLPIIITLPTQFNLQGIDMGYCIALEGVIATYYIYSVEIFSIMWILFYSFRLYGKTSDLSTKKQIVFSTTGIILFLLAFSSGNIIGSITDNWEMAQIGLFVMPIFVGILAYLVVKYNSFNVKLIATQALIWGLAVFIGSQFFFIRNPINYLLNSITFIAIIIFGILLIKSVKREIEAKEREKLQHEKFEELAGRFENINHILAHDVKNVLGKTKDMFVELPNGTFGEITDMGKSMSKRLAVDTTDLITSITNILKAGDKIIPTPKPFDFKEAVLDAVASSKDKADEEKIKIEIQIDEKENYTVNADRSLIGLHVLKCLIENAVSYNDVDGSIWINLLKKDPKTVSLIIKSTGWGMTEDDKKRLFTPGGHGKDSIKKNVHTTGYGLFIAKQTVDAHSGKIYGTSEGRGKGSTFSVELPVDFTPIVSEVSKI